MFCPNCDSQIREGSNVCSNCGATLAESNQKNAYISAAMQEQSTNVFAIVASVLLAISTFLPFETITSVNVSYSLMSRGDSIYFLGIAALGIVGALLRKNIIVIIAGIASCFLSYVEATLPADESIAEYLQWEIGFYLMIVFSVLLLISGFIKSKR